VVLIERPMSFARYYDDVLHRRSRYGWPATLEWHFLSISAGSAVLLKTPPQGFAQHVDIARGSIRRASRSGAD
jgi:hypothetical protein